MKNKTLLLLLLVALLVFVGCESDEPATNDEPTTNGDVVEDGNDELDAMVTASIVKDGDALIKGMSADGFWLVATLADITLDEELVIEGEFIHRDAIARKLGMYTQDEDRNVTAEFSLTVPRIVVKSENLRIQNGTVNGDIYVEANNFRLAGSVIVNGDVTFAAQAYADSFILDDTAVVNGEIIVEQDELDAMATASIVASGKALVEGLSADGTWIVATLRDVAVNEEVIVEGEFIHRDAVARKLGMYTQDEDRNVTAEFKLTAPKMIVRSENFKIQNGTFVGDILVEANNFRLQSATVQGNIVFASQEYMDSFILDEDATVTGTVGLPEAE